MWGVDSDGGDWPFFVKAPEFSRKDVIAMMWTCIIHPVSITDRSGAMSALFFLITVTTSGHITAPTIH